MQIKAVAATRRLFFNKKEDLFCYTYFHENDSHASAHYRLFDCHRALLAIGFAATSTLASLPAQTGAQQQPMPAPYHDEMPMSMPAGHHMQFRVPDSF